MKYIEERSSVINPLDDYQKLLKSKKKLRVKLGVDPTAPEVTLGWYAVIRALRKFQEYGHEVILILGEFTAKVGDPSGKSETRNVLDDDSIGVNSDGVLPIIKTILHKDNLEVVSNKDWLSKLTINDMMHLASSTTLAQMLEREDFSKRYDNKNPISLLEFFYPLFQGYDSVAVKSDIEIGGNDQLWNLMLGREIQKFYNIDPQIAITFPLLIGTDGKKKMSQSYDNYISITDTPENIFGKIMSIPDETMWDYFLMLTDLEIKDIETYKKDVKSDKENPFNLKKLLGNLVITELFDDQTASKAYETFENITINKNIPDEIENIAINSNIELHLPKFLLDNNIIKSNSEGRRLISSGAFKINDEKYENLDINSDDLIDKTLQIGKRNFVRIIKK
jgi:tyrosyl-tRNA synthetase